MKHQQKNHYFVQINAPDIYCVRGAWVGAPLYGSVLTSVFRSPPANVTVKQNNTLRQNNFECYGSSTVAVPARPFWLVVGFCYYIRIYMICAGFIRIG